MNGDNPNWPGIVHVADLVKVYNGKRVLDGVGLDVRRGEIFGLLGPNGAGKTTTLEILEGLRTATSGEVKMFGLDVAANRAEIRERIGVSLQKTEYWGLLSVAETIALFRSFYRRKLPVDALLDAFDLRRYADVALRKLSGGTYQRVVLALALVNDPELVFLDEPTTGLDPQARRNLWQVILDLRARGRTIILTTHYMDEAHALCDRLAIMSQGRIIRTGSPSQLVQSLGSDIAISFASGSPVDLAALGVQPWCRNVRETGADRYVLYCEDLQSGVNGLMGWAGSAGVDVRDLETRSASLDDVFLHYSSAEAHCA